MKDDRFIRIQIETDADFVQASVAMQLGDVDRVRFSQGSDARAQAVAGSSGSALVWDAQGKQPYPENGWSLKGGAGRRVRVVNENHFVNRDKGQGALREILGAGASWDFVVDMQDRRLRNVVTPDGTAMPVFTFNREIGASARVLWPLPTYHDLGSPGFLGPDDWVRVPWRKKQDRVVWRGIHGGRADKHGDVRREGLRLRPLLKRLKAGKMSEQDVLSELAYFPRHKMISDYQDDPRFDLGFTGAIQNMDIAQYPFLARLMRPRLSQQDMLNYKYLLVLRGSDVASSFYWTMNSGSLGLVMEGYFDSFASAHFKPWEHYVPFKADLSDLEDRLAWCQANDETCRDMAERAQEKCRLLARADLRDEISRAVISRISARMKGR